jgi:hypothetical protein
MLDRNIRASQEDEVALLQLTTSVDQVALAAHLPLILTNSALQLFERGRRSPYQGTPLAGMASAPR